MTDIQEAFFGQKQSFADWCMNDYEVPTVDLSVGERVFLSQQFQAFKICRNSQSSISLGNNFITCYY